MKAWPIRLSLFARVKIVRKTVSGREFGSLRDVVETVKTWPVHKTLSGKEFDWGGTLVLM